MDYTEDRSFTESEFITFEPASSPSGMKKTFSEQDFLNVVAKKSMYSPHPQYLTGYTGKLRSMKAPPEDYCKSIEPALGYSGSYTGKVDGKLGKINLHRGLISRQDRTVGHAHEHLEEPHEYDPSIEGNYMNSVLEAQSRGQNVGRILTEITTKLDFKYNSTAEKKMRIKSVFEGCDPRHTGCISSAEFNMCCVQLNIVLPREELTTLISYFDECNSGHIHYRNFINIVCPGAYSDL